MTDPWTTATTEALSDTEVRMLLHIAEGATDGCAWASPSPRDGVLRCFYKQRGSWPIRPLRPLSAEDRSAVGWLMLGGYVSERTGVTDKGRRYLTEERKTPC